MPVLEEAQVVEVVVHVLSRSSVQLQRYLSGG